MLRFPQGAGRGSARGSHRARKWRGDPRATATGRPRRQQRGRRGGAPARGGLPSDSLRMRKAKQSTGKGKGEKRENSKNKQTKKDQCKAQLSRGSRLHPAPRTLAGGGGGGRRRAGSPAGAHGPTAQRGSRRGMLGPSRPAPEERRGAVGGGERPGLTLFAQPAALRGPRARRCGWVQNWGAILTPLQTLTTGSERNYLYCCS